MSDCEQTSGIYTGIAAPSATGFSIEMKGYSFSWEASNSLVINKTFDYVAVKYTV